MPIVVPTEMLAAIDAAYQRFEAAINVFSDRLVAIPAPEIVYHYTDSAGLLGF